ncbi:MAG: hypothetical protein L3J71_16255 [Victivallaceae bacterium]|nr:hypothetical protein [Victivallaceae bacterium]
MKTGIIIMFSVLATISCDNRKRSNFIPLKNGFGYVYIESGIHVSATAELYYKDSKGNQTLIWDIPADVNQIYFHKNTAIFMGFKPAKDNSRLVDRLFVAQAPQKAVDVTNDVLKICLEQSKPTGISEDIIYKRATIATVSEKNGMLQIIFIIQVKGWPQVKCNISWETVKMLFDKQVKKK